MIERIDHVQLAMPAGEEGAARSFYDALLGIPEVPKPPHLAARGGCWFERGDLKVHLGVEADFRPARKAHPAFRVKDLPSLVECLEAAGIAVVAEPMEGHHRVYASDPFGNRLELLEPIEDTVSITRAIPDIRSDDVQAARAFYAGLVGFDVSMESGNFLLLVSPTDAAVQVSVNGDLAALPPGFIVDVGTAGRVSEIHALAREQSLRIVEELDDKPWGIRRFSLLDPSGSRVTVLAHMDAF